MRIGILGGGQLARMLALSGYPLGINFSFFDPAQPSCVEDWRYVIHANYTEEKSLQEFAEKVDIITFENENIPLETVEYLQKLKPVYPSMQSLYYSQDRLHEKIFFSKLNIPVAKFMAVDTQDDLKNSGEILGFPFLLKTRRGGYDGKGQFIFRSKIELQEFKLKNLFYGYIAEKFIKYKREVSCIGVRNIKNESVFYPLCENIHHDGILMETNVKISDPLLLNARTYMQKIFNELNYVGTLTIEFFDVDGRLYVNEMAPRVHNSGHWTIEGATTSQFENHIRAVLGYPLGSTRSKNNIKMINIIGEWPEKTDVLRTHGMHVHDYSKTPRPKRKLGHITQIDIQ